MSVTVTNPGTQNNYDGDARTLAIVGSDSGSSPFYSAASLSAGLSINNSNGEISGTIAAGAHYASPCTVTVSLMDMMTMESASQTFPWNVSQPTVSLTNPGNQTKFDGDVVSLALSASDSAGHALTYNSSGLLPTGLSLNASTGVILRAGKDGTT